jgi:integrase
MGRRNGEGSIRQKRPGLFEGRIMINRVRRQFYGRTRKEVLDKIAQARLDSGTAFSSGGDMNTGDFLTYWLGTIKNSRAHKTYESYKITVEKHIRPHLGHRPLRSLVPGDMLGLQEVLKKKGVKPPSIWYACTILKIAIRRAVYPSQFIRVNPFADARLEKPKAKKKQWWSLEQFNRVHSAAKARGDRLALFYYLDVTVGLRHAETLALKGSDFDSKAGTLTVSKQLLEKRAEVRGGPTTFELSPTKSEASDAIIPVPPEVLAAVREHQLARGLRPDDFLFMTGNGTHYTQGQVRRAFAASIRRANADLAANAAEIPKITIHDLRHTCATVLLEAGADLKDIQRQLRHENYAITAKTYAHVSDRKARATADKMSALIQGAGVEA